MLILRILCYNGSLFTWTVVSLTTAKFKPLIFSTPGFALSYIANVFTLMIFVWLLLVACIILLYNHIHTEVWKPRANHGEVCTLENSQSFSLYSLDTDRIETPLLKIHISWLFVIAKTCLQSCCLVMDVFLSLLLRLSSVMSQYLHKRFEEKYIQHR
jgi:hypothetical protein